MSASPPPPSPSPPSSMQTTAGFWTHHVCKVQGKQGEPFCWREGRQQHQPGLWVLVSGGRIGEDVGFRPYRLGTCSEATQQKSSVQHKRNRINQALQSPPCLTTMSGSSFPSLILAISQEKARDHTAFYATYANRRRACHHFSPFPILVTFRERTFSTSCSERASWSWSWFCACPARRPCTLRLIKKWSVPLRGAMLNV